MGKNKNKNKNKDNSTAEAPAEEVATDPATNAEAEGGNADNDTPMVEKEEKKEDKSDSKESETTASNDAKEETKSGDDTSSNDGVKILEEVFGKASVDEKPKSDTPEATPANAGASFGPEPPKENEYPEDEIKKAEEFKT